jgi:hypothetical protein
MFRHFAIFRAFDLFRSGSGAGSVPSNALVTADGIPLVTADGEYLITVI